MAENGVIGRGGGLPWRLPDDLEHFKAITLGCPVVMGRKTFASLRRPLPGRLNLVLTRQPLAVPGVVPVSSFAAARVAAEAAGAAPWLWAIGGAAVYAEALPWSERLEVTRVHAAVAGDVFFPPLDWASWRRVWHEDHAADARHEHAFTFERWERAAGTLPLGPASASG
ncbi:MAG: dihydrofolate reductase [Planctomycetota bacterium]